MNETLMPTLKPLLRWQQLSLKEKLEEEPAHWVNPLAASTERSKSSADHETDKWIFDRNIIRENQSPAKLSNEIYRLFDLSVE